MDRSIREERSELPTQVYDVHEYKDMMEEYVCKRYRRGVEKEMVSGIKRGNWQRPNVVRRGTELQVGQDFLCGNKRFRKGLV